MKPIYQVSLFVFTLIQIASSAKTTTPKGTTTTTPKPLFVNKFPENVGNWSATNKVGNVTCIHFIGAIQLSINYEKNNNQTSVKELDIPSNASGSGNCSSSDSKKSQNLTIAWPENSAHITFQFVANDNSTFFLYGLDIQVAKDNATFPNVTELKIPFQFSLQNISEIKTPLNSSYSCSETLSIPLNKNKASSINIAKFQVQSFMLNSKEVFGKEFKCPTSDSSMGGWKIFGIICAVFLLVFVLSGVGFYAYRRLQEMRVTYENI